jgi:hypothetical protein
LEHRQAPVPTMIPRCDKQGRPQLKKLYVRYVETFKDDDGPVRGDAVRFFNAHREEEWFWERYDPVGRRSARSSKIKMVQANKDAFYDGELDWETLTVPGVVMETDLGVKAVVKTADAAAGDGGGGEGKKEDEDEDEDAVVEGEDGMLVEKGDKTKDGAAGKETDGGDESKQVGKTTASEVEAKPAGWAAEWCTKILDPAKSVFIRTVPPRARRAQLEEAFSEAGEI